MIAVTEQMIEDLVKVHDQIAGHKNIRISITEIRKDQASNLAVYKMVLNSLSDYVLYGN